MKSIWSNDELKILKQYPKYGFNFCLKHLINKTKTQIQSKIKNLNLKLNKYAPKETGKKLKHKSVNLNIFMNDINVYSAYLLGLIWGDGNLLMSKNRISLHILENDGLNLQDIFNKTGKWTNYSWQRITDNKKYKTQMFFMTHSKLLAEHLQKYNYLNKSGGNPDILKIIPDNLKHYWFRGLIDADGCFFRCNKTYKSELSISSTINQDWSYIINLYNLLNISKYSIYRRKYKNQFSIIVVQRKRDIKLIGDYIYQGEQFGLIRKYNKFLECIK